ncbi:tol-pal system-associated acyl-CoA thioesterase [Rouxiella badensis]|nr:tol-pal system-associated acyl-CoA thioesterase [Rouxiella badensis]MCC3704218.1 tol-pal system-associated acyl-CoA thioesterase [Rouxiella badensis]MCC3719669.1 tol-pal system-associated acyl-CoA thioesterase [Rouxiella badensis]MCC3728919.1 tol-pal system-associated acyl-CoA thioesterase [Rouxiella badensis]MCC3733346.1 tol-pal system-associated acyl-CoA thioesterase [Rouxiella badensis]MCC3740885.1 tol-pal system-associated acyl-CoA thioesterase [Rouxiella badensis]
MSTRKSGTAKIGTVLTSLVLMAGLTGSAWATPSSNAANAVTPSTTTSASAAPAATSTDGSAAPLLQSTNGIDISATPAQDPQVPAIPKDLSVLGMYQHADIVVKIVMIGLLLASVVTWTLLFSKGAEVFSGKRRLRRELAALLPVRSLKEALEQSEGFSANSVSSQMLRDAENELQLSAGSTDNGGIKERTGFRLERRVSAAGRHMGRGNGILATIGAISPFVGLFGTVWGIMNSFIGIAQTQTTNLAVVAPGIAEALLATAVGLIAAIPAVVIYNIFARTIASYRHQVGDVAAQILLLQGRDLDLAASAEEAPRAQAGHQLRVG